MALMYGEHYTFYDVDITPNQKEFVKALGLKALPHIHICENGVLKESFTSESQHKSIVEDTG